jgi:hypothetical protein
MSIFTHHGPWNDHSRQSPTLRFIEKYINRIDSLDLSSTPSSAFYSPFAELHDTNGDVYTSGPHIWGCLKRLFTPFDRINHDVIEIRVVPDGSGKDVVYAQFLTRFRLRGDEEEVVAPRFFVFSVGEAEAEGLGGTDGLQIFELRVFWDTGILGRYVTERKRRAGLR